MVGRLGFVVVAAAALGLAGPPAHAHVLPGQSKAITKCESGTGSALAKFVGAKTKCISNCIRGARKSGGSFRDCFAPFTDPTINACVTGLKGAEAKAAAGITKVCDEAGSCPQCYVDLGESGCADTSVSNRWVQLKEGEVDLLSPYVYCYELIFDQVPPKALAKCEDGVAKALVKFTSTKARCYQGCYAKIVSGKIPVGSCDPPNPHDPKTNACDLGPKGAAAKAAAAIDKACFVPPAAAPECFGSFDSGGAWVERLEEDENQLIRPINCGSPSGAFVN